MQSKSTLLSSNDLDGIAEYIQSDKCKKIAILAGAGISVSAGIPDFRSSDGFYNTLNTDDFPMLTNDQLQLVQIDPQYILTIQLFNVNPSVYLHARKEFLLSGSKYQPTPTHWFFKLLEDKKLLKRFYSTNIDGLDVATGLSPDVLIHVHGTCGRAVCCQCNAEYPMEDLRKVLESNVHLKEFITCNECDANKNYIKPDTVLFGMSLPDIYWELVDQQRDLDDVDLLIVAGTSLCVSPSNYIPNKVDHKRCVRLLANRELPDTFKVGENDVFYEGDCDDAFRKLAELLGWKQDLERLIASGGLKQQQALDDVMDEVDLKEDADKETESDTELPESVPFGRASIVSMEARVLNENDGDEKKEDPMESVNSMKSSNSPNDQILGTIATNQYDKALILGTF